MYLPKYLLSCQYILSSHLHTLLPIIRYIKRSDSKLSLLIGLKSLRKLESFREELDDYLHKFLSSFWPQKIFKSWIQMCFTKYRFWQLARSGLFLNLTFWSECQKKTWSSYINLYTLFGTVQFHNSHKMVFSVFHFKVLCRDPQYLFKTPFLILHRFY